jgi:hypothetical protein
MHCTIDVAGDGAMMTGRYFLFLAPVLLGLNCCSLLELDDKRRSPEAERQLNFEVKYAMQRIQVAAEHFAADHGTDQYPLAIDDEFKSYMPGGQEGVTPAPVGPVNVFTGINQFPKLVCLKDVHSVRFGPRNAVNRGEIHYSPLANGKGYAIIGGAADGLALSDDKNPGQVLVLSNLDD